MAEKNRYWTAIGYPENFVDDWQNKIDDLLQIPYAYCIHDRCLDKTGQVRKEHVHFLLAFPNTTTRNHAESVIFRLEKDNAKAFPNNIQRVINVRYMYEYLIHNTESCKKQSKVLYDVSDRITGNNFDIGVYEQLSLGDKQKMRRELVEKILENNIMNFSQFLRFVITNYDLEYEEIIANYSGYFDRVIKGNYHEYLLDQQVDNEE